MNNAIFSLDKPQNEAIKSYVPGTKERKALVAEMETLAGQVMEIPCIIGGREIYTGNTEDVVMPHNHSHVLAKAHKAGEKEVKMAIEASMKAHREWESLSWVERASITMKIAELISKKYRALVNASTMLGQSKNVFQSEIDAVCESVDFLKFNAYYMSDIYNQQPHSEPGIINRIEYRPLEGFIFAVTPFNFTSIATNLNLAPALMGNTLIWKPARTALLSNYILMKIFMEAGVPDGVINFLPGDGSVLGNLVLPEKDLGGIHFTGSNASFNRIWKTVADNIEHYKSYPRIVGETGGKDFVLVHNTADPQEVATALVRGAFEYQGQKCSAASRAYLPKSLWKEIHDRMGTMINDIKIGPPTDFENFVNAVIDDKAFNRICGYIEKARHSSDASIIFGGKCDNSVGYFVEPTVILVTNPHFVTMEEEIFGPVLTLFVYEDNDFDEVLKLVDTTSPYGLTGSIFSNDRKVLSYACKVLKYAAGNFYYNDKPTGAVVGQQPFGGSRQSGTNDKAGSHLNLFRWVSPRTIKENLTPPTDYKYPFMKPDQCH
ncbi:MAG: L-glutamate gamma-semialdehyde dehydrogenase [Bacteroidales bacterium]